jgi:hypothetical protein
VGNDLCLHEQLRGGRAASLSTLLFLASWFGYLTLAGGPAFALGFAIAIGGFGLVVR